MRSQLSMALTNMTLSSSSASSSCDVTDLNTADVDLTYLEETEPQPQHIKHENHTERVNNASDDISRGENKAKLLTNMNGSDGEGDDDDNDLSSFDLNGLDTVGVTTSVNSLEQNDEIILNRIVDSSQVKIENASDLEQVNDLYTKLLIHSNMNSVNGINDVNVDLVTNTILDHHHSSSLKTTRPKEAQSNVNMINVGFNPMRH